MCRSSLHSESGQAAILLSVVGLMALVFGFMVVDVGVAFGARRDAQTDADLIALAAAIELPDFVDDSAGAAAAEAAADAFALTNNVELSNLTVNVIDTCFSADDGVSTGVEISVRRTPSGFFFGVFPGVPQLSVSATATACSGAPQEMIGVVPWAVETAGSCFTNEIDPADRKPIHGELCDLVVGGGAGGSDVGQLGLSDDPTDGCEDGNGSANVYEDNIIDGSVVTCAIGESVTSNTGVNVGKTKSGLEARLAFDGSCATAVSGNFGEVQAQTNTFNTHLTITDLLAPDLGGVDDFFEIWRPSFGYSAGDPGNHLEPRDCDPATSAPETSPRNVVVIIVEDITIDDGAGCSGGGGPSPHCYLILGFARMYLEGCTTASHGFSALCDQSGGGGTFTIHARFVQAVGSSTASLGVSQFGDIQTVLRD